MIPLDRVRAMLAAATPGPWVWRSDDTDGCHVVEDPRARYEEEERLAETFRESTADIILMAAAPDLAAQVLTLAAALETAQRERDSDRALIAALSHDHAAAVSDRDAMQRERDAARQAHAELASAVRAYLDAEDGYDPGCPGGCGVVECCTREAVDAARTVLDAALAAAEGTR